MQSIDEIIKSAASYLENKGDDPKGIDDWKPRTRLGMNPKLVGFLYSKSRQGTIQRKNFAASFDNTELVTLYNDLRARTGAARGRAANVTELEEPTIRDLLLTLYRYGVTFGLVTLRQ